MTQNSDIPSAQILVVDDEPDHAEVMAELEQWSDVAQAGSITNPDAPSADPDYTPAAES